eukprot:TRINITY_DN4322_c0_g2_i3.p1 TRINITY_DN4322_c0_g2~~TRINITY_DN4322_c0_g2_i3.p1  ORF type:complete len:136 (-),score=21.77 TRINITY_DN4322_c0_g2_i3:93-500(-)
MSFAAAMTRYGDKVLIALGRKHWLGDGRMIRGPLADKIGKSFPPFAYFNNAFNAAPAWKWMLSIVPIYEAIDGVPIEKLDVNTTKVLAVTGGTFGTYAMFVYPRAWLLFACNAAMCSVHSYNLYRLSTAEKLEQK